MNVRVTPIRGTIALAALVSVAAIELPAQAVGVGMDSFATIVDPVRKKGVVVVAEAVGPRGIDVTPGVPPGHAFVLPGSTFADVCVKGERETKTSTKVTVLVEQACPGKFDGYSFDQTTGEAALAGTIKTKTWLRVWRRRDSRLVLVKEEFGRSSATLDLRWVPTGTYLPWFLLFPCSGYQHDTTVEGSVRFRALDVTVKMPKNTQGLVEQSICPEF